MGQSASIVSRLMLLAFGLLVGALLFEAGSRVYLALGQRERIRERNELRLGQARASRGALKFGQIVRASDDPRVIYELVPGLWNETFRGHPLSVNPQGIRGPSYLLERHEGTLRIVALGDSIMFGWGVSERDSLPRQLEQMLREGKPPIRAEVINLAVPGYNTAMEVAVLERVGLGYRPDVVLLQFYDNDLELPNFISESPQDFLDPTRSFLLEDLLAPWVSGTDPLRATPGIARVPRRMREGSKRNPNRVPARYRYMVGLEGHRRAMSELARLREAHGFEVLVTSHRRIPRFLADICDELQFSLLATEPMLSRYMTEHGIASYLDSELTVGGDDPHLSALGNSLIAAAISNEIRSAEFGAKSALSRR